MSSSLLAHKRQQQPKSTPIPPGLQAKLAALANRHNPDSPVDQATNALQNTNINDPSSSSSSPHPSLRPAASYPPPTINPARPGRGGVPGGGLAARRAKPAFNVRDINPNVIPPTGASGGASAAGLGAGRPFLPNQEPKRGPLAAASFGSSFSSFSKIVDTNGVLNFSGKAVLHASGVNFSNGASFSINMNQLELQDELGRGNYGTVKKVLHKPTNVEMAMKEIRLELEQSKLNAIIMELDILHRASVSSENIVEFYGAFFIESCVYYCMEYMDAGSLDKLVEWKGVPEQVLARICGSMVKGLKFLKDELGVIHRDVKPTNVLVNKKGQIKLCDFGVSGQLEKSLAKTNIGCQSYMAPERIKGESQNNLGTYTVSSDVWSLGLSIIEIAIGCYPYPPESYSNVFAQLTAIVHDDPPELPNRYSEEARDWVAGCLNKQPDDRATYADLLEHPFVKSDEGRDVDMVTWVQDCLRFREAKQAAASTTSAPVSAAGGRTLSAPVGITD
ncbi:putative map kinase kinase [Moniliophthora roreri MCA 2997]|uniref:mitogen-activated protein kinase kinase n=1 Tax=Moniliophthora roreri (strain MCA 2997) TaxID=1381753 RepID=V2XBG8_MONRO|nr:putative map kinase kinase [Moniliophthora roreri MCA 2997]